MSFVVTLQEAQRTWYGERGEAIAQILDARVAAGEEVGRYPAAGRYAMRISILLRKVRRPPDHI